MTFFTTKNFLFAGTFMQAGMALARFCDCCQGFLEWQKFYLTLAGLGLAVLGCFLYYVFAAEERRY